MAKKKLYDLMPDVIEIGGVHYEKLVPGTVQLDLEDDGLNPEFFAKIDEAVKAGHFVSRAEFIRHALRVKMQEIEAEALESPQESSPE